MSTFAADINTSDYKYKSAITVKENTGERHLNHICQLSLTNSNFNFALARSDGKDLRIGLRSNGTSILNMWISNWSPINQIANVWFQIPEIQAYENLQLWVYWGNPTDGGISDITSIDAVFSDGFDGSIVTSHTMYELCRTIGGTSLASTGTPSNAFSSGFNADPIYWAGTADNQYIEFKFISRQIVNIYAMIVAINVNSPSYSTYGPKRWLFQVKDETDSWVTIDDRTGEDHVWPTIGTEFFDIPTHSYSSREYRIYVTSWYTYKRIYYISMYNTELTNSYVQGLVENKFAIDLCGWAFGAGTNWWQGASTVTYDYNLCHMVAFDNNTSSTLRWQNSGDAWLSYTFPIEVSVGAYIVNVLDTANNPTSWDFQVYTGGSWVTIDSRTSITWSDALTKSFLITPHDYVSKKYRIYCYGLVGEGIRELSMFDLRYSRWFPHSCTVSSSKLTLGSDGALYPASIYFRTSDEFVSVQKNFRLHMGCYLPSVVGGSYLEYYLMRIFFYDENSVGNSDFRIYPEGNTDLKTTMYDGSTLTTYNTTQGGIQNIAGNYFELEFGYYEPKDEAYFKLSKQSSYPDREIIMERFVEGNTDLYAFAFFGNENTNSPSLQIDWVLLREYLDDKEPTINTSNLFIEYEYNQSFDFDAITYGSDVTSESFRHEADSGNPYKLSDNVASNISSVWVNDETTSSGYLLIDFGGFSDNLVDVTCVHYDSNHVAYYNASKLSDSDSDPFSRSYWATTTTSGWACINFGNNPKMIGCLMVTGVSGSLSNMPKDFIFEGSFYDPRFSTLDKWSTLYEGTFENTINSQYIYFRNLVSYKYYRLRVLNTRGGTSTIKLREWGMYGYDVNCRKRVVKQLRLSPVKFSSYEWYFPKTISFLGSINGVSWVELIPSTSTFTPFFNVPYGGQQRYSFNDNDIGYYQYKLIYSGNWLESGNKIMVAEWEVVESISEEITLRILDSDTQECSNVWAHTNCDFDSGLFYVASEDKISYVLNDTLFRSIDYDSNVKDFVFV